MAKRTDYSKDKQKVGPFTIRFPKDFMEDIEKRNGLKKAQPIVEYLIRIYNEAFSPILGNPAMERNWAKELEDPKKRKFPDEKTKPEKSTWGKYISDDINRPDPPSGLKGIDLTIWKNENWK